jgi:hypothetical protein
MDENDMNSRVVEKITMYKTHDGKPHKFIDEAYKHTENNLQEYVNEVIKKATFKGFKVSEYLNYRALYGIIDAMVGDIKKAQEFVDGLNIILYGETIQGIGEDDYESEY